MKIFTPNTIIKSTEVNANFDDLNNGLNQSPYKASAISSAVTVVASGAAGSQITLGTERFDPNDNFASDVYTVPVTGYYACCGRISVTTPGDGVQVGGGFWVDGAVGNIEFGKNAGGVNSQTFSFSRIIYLTEGQTVGLFGYQVSGSNKNIQGNLDIALLST